MQDNFDLKCMKPQQLMDECLLVNKVFGQCRQQDCLRPTDDFNHIDDCEDDFIRIGSSVLCGNFPIFNQTGVDGPIEDDPINPGEVLRLASGFTFRFRRETFSIESITTSVEESQFCQEGYWDITIRYTFSYILNILDAAGNVVPVVSNGVLITDICACESYEKRISLFGGERGCNEVTFADSLYGGDRAFSQNAPYVQVQAIANPLKFETVISSNTCPGVPGTLCVGRANLTIGLFTIIRLYRMVSLTVQSPGYCDVPLCEGGQSSDPCEFFNNLPFPFDQFNPDQQM